MFRAVPDFSRSKDETVSLEMGSFVARWSAWSNLTMYFTLLPSVRVSDRTVSLLSCEAKVCNVQIRFECVVLFTVSK